MKAAIGARPKLWPWLPACAGMTVLGVQSSTDCAMTMFVARAFCANDGIRSSDKHSRHVHDVRRSCFQFLRKSCQKILRTDKSVVPAQAGTQGQANERGNDDRCVRSIEVRILITALIGELPIRA